MRGFVLLIAVGVVVVSAVWYLEDRNGAVDAENPSDDFCSVYVAKQEAEETSPSYGESVRYFIQGCFLREDNSEE